MTDLPQPAPQSNNPQASDLQKLLQEPGTQVWWRRRALWATLVLLLAAGGGYYYWQQSQQRSDAPSYVTEPVSKGDLTLTVTANGTLQPTRSVNTGT
jgi:HlyD family secretion protein